MSWLRHFIFSVLFSTAVFLSAQERIAFENWFLPDTSIRQGYDFEEHTSILPRIINRIDPSKPDTNTPFESHFHAYPLLDAVGGYLEKEFAFRTGAGVLMEYQPARKVYARFTYLGGFANSPVTNYHGGIFAPAYFRYETQARTIFHDVRGRVSYSPNKYFNFQAGLDHNRLGEGDRSLFLDDYGTPYPFASLRMKVWRAEYVLMYQFLREPNGNGGYFNKYAATHYLSLNLFKGFNISLYESVIFKGSTGGQNRGFEWEYLNPFVMYRPVEYGIGSSDNVQLGGQLSYTPFKSLVVYGQVLFDEFLLSELQSGNGWWANKYGFQVGVKGIEPFKLKGFTNLSEFNLVRPYTYSHGNTGQSFSHMHTVLAHPYGANFMEWNTRLKWQKGKWDMALDAVYGIRGGDFGDGVSWGGDVIQSYNNRPEEYGFYTGIGNRYTRTRVQLTGGYTILPNYRMRAFVTGDLLLLKTSTSSTLFPGIVFGISSELWNDRRNF